MLNSKGGFQTWAVVTLGQLSPWGSCLPGQLSYLGSCPTWAVVLPGQLSTWAVVAWAVVCLGSCRLGSCRCILLSDLSSGGRELNRAALLQKNPPLENDRCDWILRVFSCRLCNDWFSDLVQSRSFFARYWGSCVTNTFLTVVRVESAESCCMVKWPVTLASWAVGVTSGRFVLSLITLFCKTCNFWLSPSGECWKTSLICVIVCDVPHMWKDLQAVHHFWVKQSVTEQFELFFGHLVGKFW